MVYGVFCSPQVCCGRDLEEEEEKAIFQMFMGSLLQREGQQGRKHQRACTPELRFIPDDSLERGTKVMDLIDKISKGEI